MGFRVEPEIKHIYEVGSPLFVLISSFPYVQRNKPAEVMAGVLVQVRVEDRMGRLHTYDM